MSAVAWRAGRATPWDLDASNPAVSTLTSRRTMSHHQSSATSIDFSDRPDARQLPHAMTSDPDRQRWRGTAASVLAQIAAMVICWVALLSLPVPPEHGLDASWQLALNHDWLHRLVFGRDVVFTYGPWGWLTTVFCLQDTLNAHLVWEFAWKGLAAFSVVRVAWHISRVRAVLLYAGTLTVVPVFQDTLAMLFIAGIAIWLTGKRGVSAALLVSVGLLSGLLMLQKFTYLLMVLCGLAIITLEWGLHREWRSVIWLGASSAIGVVAWWLAASQPLLALPAFLQGSAIIAGGYSEAMFLYESPPVFALGIATVFLFMLVLWEIPNLRSAARLLMCATFGFLVWKHGFVRADGHTMGFFSCMFVFGLAAPLFLRWNARRAIASWAVSATALGGAFVAIPTLAQELNGGFWSRFQANQYALRTLDRCKTGFGARAAQAATAMTLPAVCRRVGRATIDQFGFDQAVLLGNNLNYAPRPVLQGYQAYTGKLAELNEAYYRSASAPEYTLARLESIDSRYPTLDDARLLPRLVADHAYVMSEKGYLLLQRHPVPAEIEIQPLNSGKLRYGTETCELPHVREGVWVQIDVPPSWLGILRTLVYKPPEVTLVIRTEADEEFRFRLIVPAARGGFLLSPYLNDTADLERLVTRRIGRAVRSFRLEIRPQDQVFFLKRARYEISLLSDLKFSGADSPATVAP